MNPWASPPPLVNPGSPASDPFFAAFPARQRQQMFENQPGQAPPWSSPPQGPPWGQTPPSTFGPPPWATNTPQRPPTPPWQAPSPFRNQGMGLSDDDSWGPPWGSNIQTRPTESNFNQPITSGFFGANASPNRNQTPSQWNGIIRSTSERQSREGPGGSPWWPQTEPPWNLTRSRSVGPNTPRSGRSVGLPGYLIPDTWDETNLARRPRDWRAGYSPKGSSIFSLPGLPSPLLRNESDVQETTDNTKRRLTPFLEWHATQTPVAHDLRLDPLHPATPILHAQMSTVDFRNPFSDLDMKQFATTPTADFLRLFHPKLPWYIDIAPTHPNGITVEDVLSQLYDALQQPILHRHYWNEALSQKNRRDISKAFDRRVKLLGTGRENGIFWIDFLCEEIIFEGLTRVKGGLWEIKTKNAYQ